MVTISTETRTLYIDTDLIKYKLKKAVKTVLKALSTICAVGGILLVIGTATASDHIFIPFNQIIARMMQGVLLCGIAYIFNSIKKSLK